MPSTYEDGTCGCAPSSAVDGVKSRPVLRSTGAAAGVDGSPGSDAGSTDTAGFAVAACAGVGSATSTLVIPTAAAANNDVTVRWPDSTARRRNRTSSKIGQMAAQDYRRTVAWSEGTYTESKQASPERVLPGVLGNMPSESGFDPLQVQGHPVPVRGLEPVRCGAGPARWLSAPVAWWACACGRAALPPTAQATTARRPTPPATCKALPRSAPATSGKRIRQMYRHSSARRSAPPPPCR